jgi:hypothetical protein
VKRRSSESRENARLRVIRLMIAIRPINDSCVKSFLFFFSRGVPELPCGRGPLWQCPHAAVESAPHFPLFLSPFFSLPLLFFLFFFAGPRVLLSFHAPHWGVGWYTCYKQRVRIHKGRSGKLHGKKTERHASPRASVAFCWDLIRAHIFTPFFSLFSPFFFTRVCARSLFRPETMPVPPSK